MHCIPMPWCSESARHQQDCVFKCMQMRGRCRWCLQGVYYDGTEGWHRWGNLLSQNALLQIQ